MQSKTIKWTVGLLVAIAIGALAIGFVYQTFVIRHPVTSSLASTSLGLEYAAHPGIVALALGARCRTGEYVQAQQLIRQIATPIKSAAVRRAIAHCNQDFTFARAASFLRKGDAAGAIRLMTPWYPKGPDPYRAGVILMRSDILEHHLNQAIAMGSALAARYPGDSTLLPLVRELKNRAVLDRAQAALHAGHFAQAIGWATPAYQNGPNFYRAGLILAQSDLAEHHLRRADAVYAALARRYPKDPRLGREADSLRTRAILTAARAALIDHQPALAIRRIRTRYPNGSAPYDAKLILAEAYASEHRINHASRIYHGLVGRYPKNRALAVAAENLSIQKTRAVARAELAAHEPRRAIRTIRPLYRSGRDPYDSGLVLASAEVALHHFARAERIYAVLARRYPRDRALGAAAENLRTRATLAEARAELAAHEPRRAIRTIRTLYRS
ncbi:MAG: hypothetical protein ACYCVU_08860, partial [Gammaproteobacteria bacterium]